MTLTSSLFCHLATSGSLQHLPILLPPRTSQHLPHLCCRRQHPTIGLDTSQTTMSPSLSLHTPGGGRGNGTQHSSTSLLLAPSVFFRSNYSRPLGVGNRQQQYTLTTRPPPSPGPTVPNVRSTTDLSSSSFLIHKYLVPWGALPVSAS